MTRKTIHPEKEAKTHTRPPSCLDVCYIMSESCDPNLSVCHIVHVDRQQSASTGTIQIYKTMGEAYQIFTVKSNIYQSVRELYSGQRTGLGGYDRKRQLPMCW